MKSKEEEEGAQSTGQPPAVNTSAPIDATRRPNKDPQQYDKTKKPKSREDPHKRRDTNVNIVPKVEQDDPEKKKKEEEERKRKAEEDEIKQKELEARRVEEEIRQKEEAEKRKVEDEKRRQEEEEQRKEDEKKKEEVLIH